MDQKRKGKKAGMGVFRPLKGLLGPAPHILNNPFEYDVHPWVKQAATDLQVRISEEVDHDFGLEDSEKGLGKMMGVLVVQNRQGEYGYLAAYSGRLDDGNQHYGYVPPVFDLLDENGFYRKEEDEITAINHEVIRLENDPAYLDTVSNFQTTQKEAEAALQRLKEEHRLAREKRKEERSQLQGLSEEENQKRLLELDHESARHHYEWKDASRFWKEKVNQAQNQVEKASEKIQQLKEERKARSAALQQKLFLHYSFLNAEGDTKSLADIFDTGPNNTPPSGAGECCAPKLLHYAYHNGYTPLAIGEFWWGKTPPSEVRLHGRFYPACKSKCEPILGHMLQGLNVEQRNRSGGQAITIIREDEHLAIIHKPHGLLSVPGKGDLDNVAAQVRDRWPKAQGPMMVHRLDMDTSGLMIIAKTWQAYHDLQQQFLHHRIQKTYLALLEGTVENESGIIELPLRVDLEDRPRQVVCYEYGKPAVTRYKVIENTNGQSRVHFFPMTGRTHQLRLHAAHHLGLNSPIVGDDLYGHAADRLHLQAIGIEFIHPFTGEKVKVWAKEEF